jgi:hypothetical protein
MSPEKDNLRSAVVRAMERDLKPLAEECAREPDLDRDQAATIAPYLGEAWLLGVRASHAVLVETEPGQTDPESWILVMQGEFRDLMERLSDDLAAPVGATLRACSYLAHAWIDGARFWNVEVAARLIERSTGGIDEALRRLQG